METIEALKNKYSCLSEQDLIEVIAKLLSENNKLKTLLFASRSERSKPEPGGMTPLFNEAQEVNDGAPLEDGVESDSESSSTDGDPKPIKPKRGKRRPLPDHLPRVRREIDLPEADKICKIHGKSLIKIGETITERLEIVPAKIFVQQDVVLKYKAPCCEACFHSADKDASPIPKSFATASLLAYIVTSKYVDGLPLYRQERIFDRLDINLNRTTMARWIMRLGDLTKSLVNLLHEDLINSPVIHVDETVVQVLKEAERPAEAQSYMWCMARQGTDPIIFFRYYPSRSKKTALDLLDGYKGTLVSDGYKVYNSLKSNLDVTLQACLAHVRRKFWQAEKIAKKEAKKSAAIAASEALRMIKALYKIEKEIKGQASAEKLLVRQQKSVPILDQFQVWLDKMTPSILPSSPTGKAISYAIDQWDKLTEFTRNGDVPIDNNYVEAHIRPFVIGRNAWMFADTPTGAEASANLYTLVETAKANCIDPHDYLTLIFKELPLAQTADALEKLLPYQAKSLWKLKSYQAAK